MRPFLENLNHRPGAPHAAIADCEKQFDVRLPEEYVQFLKFTNGGEGFLGKKYVIFWGVEELTSMNQSYEVQTYAPGLLIFGSSGGGEAYGFDMRTANGPVVRVPFVGMNWDDAEVIGTSFSEFLERLHEAE